MVYISEPSVYIIVYIHTNTIDEVNSIAAHLLIFLLKKKIKLEHSAVSNYSILIACGMNIRAFIGGNNKIN